MAPPSAPPAPMAPEPISLASGVMYYPPTPPVPLALPPVHPPIAHPPDLVVPELGSTLLDTAVDKVMFLVMRELGLGQFSKRITAAEAAAVAVGQVGHVHNEAEHVAAAVADAQAQAGSSGVDVDSSDPRHAHFDPSTSSPTSTTGPGTLKSHLSVDLSSTHLDESSHSHTASISSSRPKPTPTQVDIASTSISNDSIPTSEASMDSIGSASGSVLSRKTSKRRKNTMGEPGRPELSFEKELMGILECDVCALLLYEPVTSPCQHVSF